MIGKNKKNLLILTQKVDVNDDLLGFFHGWIKEFAKHCDKVIVIALGVGKYELPDNVKVYSLGKEKSDSQSHSVLGKINLRLGYIARFYKLIFKERKNYDSIFVHMNKEYAALGGLFWMFMSKPVNLWYNHISGNWISSLAGLFSQRLFYTSPFSFFSQNSKAQKMPVGVDTDLFNKGSNIPQADSILCLGRISPVKNLETLLNAALILDKQNIEFVLNIVGNAPDRDRDYYAKIRMLAKPLENKKKIFFFDKVPFQKTPEVYAKNGIYVNLTNSGSLDKTTFEAMACGLIPIVSNESFLEILPEQMKRISLFKENNPDDLADKLLAIKSLKSEERDLFREEARQTVVNQHSLSLLADKIFSVI